MHTAPAHLTAAENHYHAVCLDEEATPERIIAATDRLHAAQADARAEELAATASRAAR